MSAANRACNPVRRWNEKNGIYVAYGATSIKRRACCSKRLAQQVGAPGGEGSLKPNLVVASGDEGATTHTQILAALIEHLKDGGVTDIEIIEGSWVGTIREERTAARL